MSEGSVEELFRSVMRLLRMLTLKCISGVFHVVETGLILPIAVLIDCIVNWVQSRIGVILCPTGAMSKVVDALTLVRGGLSAVYTGATSKTPQGAVERFRRFSSTDLDCAWLNSCIKRSWGVGMASNVEHQSEAYIKLMLGNHSLGSKVKIVRLSLASHAGLEQQQCCPVIRSINVHEPSPFAAATSKEGEEQLVLDVDFSWHCMEGELVLLFTNFSGNPTYLKLHALRASGVAICTLVNRKKAKSEPQQQSQQEGGSSPPSSSSFIPWDEVTVCFKNKPALSFDHQIFRESFATAATAAPVPLECEVEGEVVVSPLFSSAMPLPPLSSSSSSDHHQQQHGRIVKRGGSVTAMVVDGVVGLLKSKLREAAHAPRSVRFPLK
jgi:hypothetical protein